MNEQAITTRSRKWALDTVFSDYPPPAECAWDMFSEGDDEGFIVAENFEGYSGEYLLEVMEEEADCVASLIREVLRDKETYL